jgi:hypothetical protein
MLKDLNSHRKIDKQTLLAAIESLQIKGWDVNPYTVADELKVPRANLYRDPELMELINKKMSQAGKTTTTGSVQSDIVQANSMLVQENEVLRHELELLRLENLQLKDRLANYEQAQVTYRKSSVEMPSSQSYEQIAYKEAPYQDTPLQEAPYIINLDQSGEQSQTMADIPPVDEPVAEEAAIIESFAPMEESLEEVLDEILEINREYRADEETDPREITLVDAEKQLGEDVSSDAQLTQTKKNKDSIFDLLSGYGNISKVPSYNKDVQSRDEQSSSRQTQAIDLQASNLGQETAQEVFANPEEPNNEVSDNGAPEGKEVSKDELHDLLQSRLNKQQEEKEAEEKQAEEAKRGLAGRKFASKNTRNVQEIETKGFVLRSVPPDIRKACMILGLRPDELTIEKAHEAWKREITRPGMHPDHGGDTETAVYLNTAKDEIYHWLEQQAPKLGKKFGQSGKDKKPVSPVSKDTETDDSE